jgi:Fur family ferric uptake transcriptional regulator
MKQPCHQHAIPHRLVQQPLSDLTDRLRARSRKVTGQREAILDVLRRHANPLTNREIHAALRGSGCDLATIYRTMHTLLGMGVVQRCDFGDGVARFELATGDAHHHHLVCRACAMVVEVNDCFPAQLEETIAQRHGFVAISHRLEFFGVCPRCQDPAPGPPKTP